MNELKELRIDSGVLILDGHRVLAPIIPRTYKDIDNDVLVKGEGFVDGAVYARKFEVEKGPITVCGALYVKANFSANPANDQKMFFKKAVAAAGRIELYDAGRKHFGADINAQVVTLKNAVVAANIFAPEIKLENCVVLGGVFASKSLKITNSIIGTFNAPSVEIVGNIYMLYPSVFSVEPLILGKDAKIYNLTLADWGALMLGNEESPLSGMIEINPETDVQTTSLSDNTLWQTYSVAGKVLTADLLDLRKLKNHFILSAASLNEQLVRSYDLGTNSEGATVKLDLETIGQFFMDILSGKITVRPLDGKISFEELKERYAEA
jgi:hypothetical protein